MKHSVSIMLLAVVTSLTLLTSSRAQELRLEPQPVITVPQMVSAEFKDARISLRVEGVIVTLNDGRRLPIQFAVSYEEYQAKKQSGEDFLAYVRRAFKVNPRVFLKTRGY